MAWFRASEDSVCSKCGKPIIKTTIMGMITGKYVCASCKAAAEIARKRVEQANNDDVQSVS